jgi:hypothetical protein
MFARIVIVIGVFLVLWAVFVRPSEGAGHEQVYVVRPTDTLWSIAAGRYAGDPREAIWRSEQRNHLHGDLLSVGQQLVLPP